MHLFDRNTNFLGGHGIVGGHVPIATGVGFAIKYRGTDQVILCFMGESVVNTGAFHEALNMAALWKLPVVFIIENNRYGMGTALERASAIHDIYQRGACVRHAACAGGRAGRARRPRRGRRGGAPRPDAVHADAPRGAHLPVHGALDVRRGQRHVPLEAGTGGVHEARPDPRPARPHGSVRRDRRRGDGEARRRGEGDRAGLVGLRRCEPRARPRSLWEDVLVETTT
jgi:hypothetical protein